MSRESLFRTKAGDRKMCGPIDPYVARILNHPQMGTRILDPGRRMCENASTNTIGSLLLKKHQEKIVAALKEHQIGIAKEVQRPIQIFHDVPLYFWDDHARKSFSLIDNAGEQLKAQTLLAKYGCGSPAGVVVEGLGQGILTIPRHSDFYSGATVIRLWNNFDLSRAEDYGCYHTPYGFDGEFDLASTDDPSLNQYHDEFKTLVEQNPSVNETFFTVCQAILGISINTEEFHYIQQDSRQELRPHAAI